DGHKSHVSEDFELKCREAKIICLCLPPHTSDVLQPLDLRMFSPLKTLHALQHQMDGAPTKKKDFLRLYRKARQLTMTTRAMHKCFETAGLVPFNPQLVISRDEVKKRPRTPTP
ncbi:Fot5 transposase, partial [Aureobasidium namibiae CBS 147.97]